jgi:polyisoprenoid-binding protein YceI
VGPAPIGAGPSSWERKFAEGGKSRHTWGLRPVRGVFGQVTGNDTVTPAGQVTGTLTIAAGSIDTKNTMRDKDLRSAKLFDIASHPDITYTVDGMQPASGGIRVTGSLTVRGTGVVREPEQRPREALTDRRSAAVHAGTASSRV